jgi:hypothetical protein
MINEACPFILLLEFHSIGSPVASTNRLHELLGVTDDRVKLVLAKPAHGFCKRTGDLAPSSITETCLAHGFFAGGVIHRPGEGYCLSFGSASHCDR